MGKIRSIEELKLDSSLQEKFRKTLQESPVLKSTLKTLKGKNKLNVVYSAMDWISVGVEGTKNVDFDINGIGYNHVNTLKLTQYIICVDLILESIHQLYRVIKDIFKTKYIFKDTKHIFNKKISDESYFKHLRAIFGIHPVNLKSLDGIEETNSDGKRYFSSWVAFAMSREYDFEVSIYGNDIEEDNSEIIGISLEKINCFVRERYNLLNELIALVVAFEQETSNQFKGTSISLQGTEKIEILHQLLAESKKRFKVYSYYHALLEYMIECFDNKEKLIKYGFEIIILENYLKRLSELIPEIKSNLENMTHQTIEIGILGLGYEFEKIAKYFCDHQNEVGKEYFINLVKYSNLPNEIIGESFAIRRLAYDSYLYSKMEGKKHVLYKDLINNPELYIFNGNEGYTGYIL